LFWHLLKFLRPVISLRMIEDAYLATSSEVMVCEKLRMARSLRAAPLIPRAIWFVV
jgi:hypothetical protein